MNLPQGKLTNGLVIANVVIFLLLWLSGYENAANYEGGLIPARFDATGSIFGGYEFLIPLWLTPFTSAFLHSGLMHLGFNMLMLIFCGRYVEQALGPVLMAVLYFIGAYSAGVAEIAFNGFSEVPVIGASGAISSIIGAYAILFAQSEVKSFGPLPGHVIRILWLGVAWIGIQLLVGAASQGTPYGIAIYAHIGGFIAGLLLTRPLLNWRFRQA